LNTYVGIAEKWYASATVWAAAGVVVALLVGVAASAVAYVVGFPKRRLLYGMPVMTPLLSTEADVKGDLELRRHGTLLADPHVLEIRLIGRGRKDIPSSAYDSGQPIRLDVGARIVKLLQSTSDPQSDRVPKAAVHETSLTIGPSRIGRRQVITYTLLADGERPHLTFQSDLIDVDVRQQEPEDLMPMWAVALSALSVLSAALAVLELSAAASARSAAATAGAAAAVAGAAGKATTSTGRLTQELLTRGRGAVLTSELLKLMIGDSHNGASALANSVKASEAIRTSSLRTANFQTLTGWALAALAAVAFVTVVITLLRRRARRATPKLR
jgi:hypothetical protein